MEKPQLIYDYSKCFKSRENNINPEFKNFVPTGNCCCNCKYQIKLTCHPWNKNFGKGKVSEICGYACTYNTKEDPEKLATFSDDEHGLCELHCRKKVFLKNENQLII